MLRITVEMLPKGDEKRAYTICQGIIANDGTGDERTGNYEAAFTLWGSRLFQGRLEDRVWRHAEVRRFRRPDGPWKLLYLALKNAIGG